MAVATQTPVEPMGYPTRRLQDASDGLIGAIDELTGLTGGWEYAVDELVNVSFDLTQEFPRRDEINPIRLAAARERLHASGLEWAGAVVQAAGQAAVDEYERSPEFRGRLVAALHRIGHRASPVFHDRLADAFVEVSR